MAQGSSLSLLKELLGLLTQTFTSQEAAQRLFNIYSPLYLVVFFSRKMICLAPLTRKLAIPQVSSNLCVFHAFAFLIVLHPGISYRCL